MIPEKPLDLPDHIREGIRMMIEFEWSKVPEQNRTKENFILLCEHFYNQLKHQFPNED